MRDFGESAPGIGGGTGPPRTGFWPACARRAGSLRAAKRPALRLFDPARTERSCTVLQPRKPPGARRPPKAIPSGAGCVQPPAGKSAFGTIRKAGGGLPDGAAGRFSEARSTGHRHASDLQNSATRVAAPLKVVRGVGHERATDTFRNTRCGPIEPVPPPGSPRPRSGRPRPATAPLLAAPSLVRHPAPSDGPPAGARNNRAKFRVDWLV